MKWAVLASLLVLCGCAHKRTYTHYRLEPQCINWVQLYCGPQGPPNDCKKVTVDYKKGCEQLSAK